MPGFCARIVLVFISGVELFDYVVDGGGICKSMAGESERNRGYGLKMGAIKPSVRHGEQLNSRLHPPPGETLFAHFVNDRYFSGATHSLLLENLSIFSKHSFMYRITTKPKLTSSATFCVCLKDSFR